MWGNDYPLRQWEITGTSVFLPNSFIKVYSPLFQTNTGVAYVSRSHPETLSSQEWHTQMICCKYSLAWPWFSWRLLYFIDVCHRFRMTCGTLPRLIIPLVWRFVTFGKSFWENYMLIQNTDVIVTGRENESLNKCTHSYCMSSQRSSKFLWLGCFLFYGLSPSVVREGK